MFRFKNKFSLSLAVLAVLSLALFSVGGEFLHGQIHHHTTQASHDECSIYLLQAQVFILLAGILLALVFQTQRYVRRTSLFHYSHYSFDFPPLRAPPVSHS